MNQVTPLALGKDPKEIKLFNTTAQDLLAEGGPVDAEGKSGGVDLVLTDPPYIISRESGFNKKRADGKYNGNPSLAINLKFGKWDDQIDGFTMEDLEESMSGIHRALRPGGVAIVFFDLWKVSDLARIMKDLKFEGIAMIEWLKSNAVPINSRKNYLSNAREVAVVGYKAKGDVQHTTENRQGAFTYPIYAGKDRFHPTQKSLALFEELIKAHTNPGDTVLDCFSGSATTGVAAINTGRQYIGAEPDDNPDPKENYFSLSSDRLRSAFDRKNVS
tara:strand:- start:235 stop:1056 length:822 start_codon:yes stop_codon:yes gene_type:complete